MSVYTFVLTYSMGDSCKHLDCIFTQRCSFFCRHVFVKKICEVVYLSQILVFSMLFTTFNLGTCIYFKIVFLKVLIFYIKTNKYSVFLRQVFMYFIHSTFLLVRTHFWVHVRGSIALYTLYCQSIGSPPSNERFDYFSDFHEYTF